MAGGLAGPCWGFAGPFLSASKVRDGVEFGGRVRVRLRVRVRVRVRIRVRGSVMKTKTRYRER